MTSKLTHSLEVLTEGKKVSEGECQRLTKLLAESRDDTLKLRGDVTALQKSLESQARVRRARSVWAALTLSALSHTEPAVDAVAC
jgi:hypothetical protein